MNRMEIAIGWTLIHSLWQAGFAAVLLFLLFRIVRSSVARYTLACLALLAAMGAFGASLLYFFTWEPNSPDPALMVGARGSQTSAIALGKDAAIQFTLALALPWITALWLVGVAVFNLRHLANWMATHRLRTRGVCAAPDQWQDRLNRAAARLSISKAVSLLESCLVEVPIVIGLMRPVILFPIGLLAGLPADQVELILMHELAHIRRWDYVVNLLQTCTESVMFHNPAIWWISKAIRTEREHCCDDIVVAATENAHAYASALAALEETRQDRAGLALASTGGTLMKRIDRLLRPPEIPGFAWTPLVGTGILIAVTAAVLVARPGPRAPSSATTASAQAPTALERWVTEDVAYIITEQEREAFRNLRSDEERAQFIAQFWQRRDPTPGTVENEFKDEYYRRIGEANQKFTTMTGVLGWKTDRGRIYITYGKPDEMESHPSGGIYARPIENGGDTTVTFPFEIWRYRYIEGIGNEVLLQFVDTTRTADFRLTVDPNEKDRLLHVPAK